MKLQRMVGNFQQLEYFIKYNEDVKKLFETRINPFINKLCLESLVLFKDKVNWKKLRWW